MRLLPCLLIVLLCLSGVCTKDVPGLCEANNVPTTDGRRCADIIVSLDKWILVSSVQKALGSIGPYSTMMAQSINGEMCPGESKLILCYYLIKYLTSDAIKALGYLQASEDIEKSKDSIGNKLLERCEGANTDWLCNSLAHELNLCKKTTGDEHSAEYLESVLFKPKKFGFGGYCLEGRSSLCVGMQNRISKEQLLLAFQHPTRCIKARSENEKSYCTKVVKERLKTGAETKKFYRENCGQERTISQNKQCQVLLQFCEYSPKEELDGYCDILHEANELWKEVKDAKNKQTLQDIAHVVQEYCTKDEKPARTSEMERELCRILVDNVIAYPDYTHKMYLESCKSEGPMHVFCDALIEWAVNTYDQHCPTVKDEGCEKAVLFCGGEKTKYFSSKYLSHEEQKSCNRIRIKTVDDPKPDIPDKMAKLYGDICNGAWEQQCVVAGAKFLKEKDTEIVKNLRIVCETEGIACTSVLELILNSSEKFASISNSICTSDGQERGEIPPMCQKLIDRCHITDSSLPASCQNVLEDEQFFIWLKAVTPEDSFQTATSLQGFCKEGKEKRNCQRSLDHLLNDEETFAMMMHTACGNEEFGDACDAVLEKTFTKGGILYKSFTMVCRNKQERRDEACTKMHHFCGEHSSDSRCLAILYTYRVDSIGTLLEPFNVEEITKLYSDTCSGEYKEICNTLEKELKDVAISNRGEMIVKLCLTGTSTAAARIPACDSLLTDAVYSSDAYDIFTSMCKVTELSGTKEEMDKCKIFFDSCKLTRAFRCYKINKDEDYTKMVVKMKETDVEVSAMTLMEACNERLENLNCGRLRDFVMKKESFAIVVTKQVCNDDSHFAVCSLLVENIYQQPFFVEFYNSSCSDAPARAKTHCLTIKIECMDAEQKHAMCTYIERRDELDGIEWMLEREGGQESNVVEMYETMCDGETDDLCMLMDERLLREDVKDNFLGLVVKHLCDPISSILCTRLLQSVLTSKYTVYTAVCDVEQPRKRSNCELYLTFCETSTDENLKSKCEEIRDDKEYAKYLIQGFEGKTTAESVVTLNTLCIKEGDKKLQRSSICERLLQNHVRKNENTHIGITEEGCRKSEYEDLCSFLVEDGYGHFPYFIKTATLRNCGNENAPTLLCPTMIKQCDSTKDKQKCIELHEMKCNGKTKEDEFCKEKFDFYCTLDSQTIGEEAKRERDTCIRFVNVLETKKKIYLDMLFERCETEATKEWCDRIITAILPLANEALRDCDNDNGKHLKACERVLTVCKSKFECSLRVPIQECEKESNAKEDALKCEAHITSQCSMGEFPGKSVSCENFVEQYASKENLELLLEHSTICSAEIEEPMYSHCRKIGSAFDMLNSGKQLFNEQCAKGEKFGETNNCLVLQHTCNIIETDNSICKTVRIAGSILKDYSTIVEGKENTEIDISQAVVLLSKYCPEEDTQFSEVFCDLPETYFKKNSISISIYGNACDSEQTRVCDRYFDKTIKTLSDGEIFENVYTPVCDDSEKRKTTKCENLHGFCQPPKDSDQCVTISRQYEVDQMEETHFKSLNSQKFVEFYGKICDDGKTETLCQGLEKRILEDSVDSSKFVDLVRDMCSQDHVMKEPCERFLSVILKSSRSDEIFLVNCNVDKEDGQSNTCKGFFNSCPVESAEPYEGCAKVKVDRRYTELKVLLEETNIPESASTVFTACSKEGTVESQNCQRLTATVAASETFIVLLSETLCNNETVETFNETVCDEMLKLALEKHKEAIDKLAKTNCETKGQGSLCTAIKSLCEPATGRRCFVFHNIFCGEAGKNYATHKECFDYFKVYCTDMEKIAESEEETENEHCLTFLNTTFEAREDSFLGECEPDIKACANGAELDLKNGHGKIMSSMFARKCDKKADSEKILCTTVQNLCAEETKQNREPCGVVAEPTCQNRPFQECLPYLGRHCSGEVTSTCTQLLSKSVTDAKNAIGVFVHYCASGKSKEHCTTALKKSLEKGTLVEAFDLLCTTPEQVLHNASCGAISTYCSNKQEENCKTIIKKKKMIDIESGSTCTAADADCDNKLNEFCVSSFQKETCEKLFSKMSKEILLEYYKKFCRNDENAAMCQRTKEEAEKSHFVGYFFGQICKGTDILFSKECKKTLRGLCSDTTVEGCDTVHSPYTLILVISGVGAGLSSLLMISAVVLFVYKSKKLASKQLQVAQKKKDVQLDPMMGSPL